MPELLKNRYNKTYLSKLAHALNNEQKQFQKDAFIHSVFNKEWKHKELKSRMIHISDMINEHLSGTYTSKLKILTRIAPDFTGLEGMFIPHFIESHGLEHWELSMEALEKITPYASGEFAIRKFLIKDQNRAMEQMLNWSKHPNHHVRRLSSEGCRPRLPWACALPELKRDPRSIIPILTQLKEDDFLYVRKSVANNLNDISKDHPQLIQDIIRLWQGNDNKTDWIIKHGSRTLLKSGNPTTLKLFDYPHPKHITIEYLRSSELVKIGETLTFDFSLIGNPKIGKLRLEYRIEFIKASGKTSAKIFKISEGTIEAANLRKSKKHSFKQLSTRKHYPGQHRLALIVNGIEKASAYFEVLD